MSFAISGAGSFSDYSALALAALERSTGSSGEEDKDSLAEIAMDMNVAKSLQGMMGMNGMGMEGMSMDVSGSKGMFLDIKV